MKMTPGSTESPCPRTSWGAPLGRIVVLTGVFFWTACGSSEVATQPNPVPTITALSPTSAIAGGAGFTLTVTGSNFIRGSVVRWNGAGRTTTFVSGATLTVTISEQDIATAGTANVSVFNPPPGGGTSASFPFSIQSPLPVPVATALTPASAPAGSLEVLMVVDGEDFVERAVVRWNGTDLPTTFVSDTRLHARVSQTELNFAGVAEITVRNPAPDSGVSNRLDFIVASPLELDLVADGFLQPLGLENAGDGSGRLFLLELGGKIWILDGTSVLAEPFLDLTGKVSTQEENGLLGLTFHPRFSQNGRFYVYYTRDFGDPVQLQSVVAEFLVSGTDPNKADAASERILLVVDQPHIWHNAGQLAFGPDGYLYIAFGDGGGIGDPWQQGQDITTLLGALVRVDVDHPGPEPYGIPADNPFVGVEGADEIWAYGFRNPWRFSFDFPTQRLFAGDVGQDAWEEVDIVVRGGNYGWSVMEGSHCYPPEITDCDTTSLLLPIHEYGREDGRSVTGGFVYRGSQIPALAGSYVFGDFISGGIWSLAEAADGTWHRTKLFDTDFFLVTFGRDEAEELYVVDFGGAVYRLRQTSAP
jgi:glucose/arabinose dehydrogenase